MAIKALDYVIKLSDQVSAPLRGVMNQIDNLKTKGKKAMGDIFSGGAGVMAAGYSLKAALDPAIEFSRALAEVEATGMGAKGLEKVTNYALEFSSTFGTSSKDVVNSVNEIARAVDGLTDDEMIAFSRSSNILAKATGSNVTAMGSYLSQLYGIFGDQADKMGKSEWAEQISAQAVITANKFKSSGESLMQAYTNLGSAAKDHGIATAEQFAVVGRLQNVFEGGLAGTKYAAFLNGAIKAQGKLGISFTDSQGKMLPMIAILEKIKAKFGDLDSNELYTLQKAFGTKEAAQVINNLLPKIDALKADIAEIGGAKNLDDAIRISHIVTDSWARFSAILENVKVAIGGQVLARIEPFLNKIANMGQDFVKWLRLYKNIARWIGYITAAAIGFAGLTATFVLMSGVISAIGIAFNLLLSPIMLIGAGIVGLGVLIFKYRKQIGDFCEGFVAGFKMARVSVDPLFEAFFTLRGALGTVLNAMGAVFGALFGGADGLYTFKQAGVDFGAAVGAVFNMLAEAINGVAHVIEMVANIFAIVAAGIIETWGEVIKAWSAGDVLGVFSAMGSGIIKTFAKVWDTVKNSAIKVINGIIKMLNHIPSFNIPLIPVMGDAPAIGAGNATSALATGIGAQALRLPQSTKPQLAKAPQGGITKAISQQNQMVKNVVFNGGVHIKTDNPQDFWQKTREAEQLKAG